MICKISHISTDSADSRKKSGLTGLQKENCIFLRQCIPVVPPWEQLKCLKTILKIFQQKCGKEILRMFNNNVPKQINRTKSPVLSSKMSLQDKEVEIDARGLLL